MVGYNGCTGQRARKLWMVTSRKIKIAQQKTKFHFLLYKLDAITNKRENNGPFSKMVDSYHSKSFEVVKSRLD